MSKKILLSCCFMFFILSVLSGALYADNFENISIQNKLQNELEKLKILPDDKILVKYGSSILINISVIVKVTFKDLVILPLNDDRKYLHQQKILLELFTAAGNDVLKEFNDYYNFCEMNLKSNGKNENFKEQLSQHNKKFETAIEAFNEAINNSDEARSRIAEVYRKYKRKEVEYALRYSESENGLTLLYFKGGFESGGYHDGFFTLGVQLSHYFLKPLKNYNFGFIINPSYIGYAGNLKGKNAFKQNYASLDMLLSFKLFSQDSIVFSSGFSGLLYFGGDDLNFSSDGYTRKYENLKKFVPGVVFEFGYLSTPLNDNYTWFIILSYKYFFTPIFTSNNQINDSFFGFKIGVGFNLFQNKKSVVPKHYMKINT